MIPCSVRGLMSTGSIGRCSLGGDSVSSERTARCDKTASRFTTFSFAGYQLESPVQSSPIRSGRTSSTQPNCTQPPPLTTTAANTQHPLSPHRTLPPLTATKNISFRVLTCIPPPLDISLSTPKPYYLSPLTSHDPRSKPGKQCADTIYLCLQLLRMHNQLLPSQTRGPGICVC